MTDLPLFGQEAGREARDEAMQRVDEHSPEEWKEAALHVIRELAEKQPTIHPDDAREAIASIVGEPHEWRILGPLLLTAQRRGWIEKSGLTRQSRISTNHAHERQQWKSRLYSPNSFEAEGRERKARALARALWRLDQDLPGKKSDAPLSERAAAMEPSVWEALAKVADRNPPSDATVARVVELLREAERMRAAS